MKIERSYNWYLKLNIKILEVLLTVQFPLVIIMCGLCLYWPWGRPGRLPIKMLKIQTESRRVMV